MFARTALTALVVFICIVIDQPRCFGQAFSANLTGLVTDPAGASVPGITIKVLNTATREERQTKAGSEGRYSFSQLVPGTYELTAGAPGFQTFVERNITLVANQSAALNITLQLGEITQRVEIAEASVQLDTQTANQSVTLNENLVKSLPTNARNPMLLVYATAGVTAPTTGMTQSTADQNYDRFGFNGGRSTTTQILLDGVSVSTGNGWNGQIYTPSVDSVAEVQVIRNSYDAQFGRSGGGVVSVVTKGGGAAFHGTLFEFLRNSDLDANSWENNKAGKDRPIFQRNQFGGNASGPIWKSKKLFFFGGYEGLRQGSPSTATLSMPTDAQKRGDFSGVFNSNGTLDMIFNPLSTRPNPSGAGYVRDAFPGNIIPASLMDPVGVKTVALYPEPTGPGNPFTHALNYVATGKGTAVTDRADIRADWAHSEKFTIYGRYSEAFRENGLPAPNVWQSSTGTGPISGNPRYQSTIGATFIPNPTWVINILAGHGAWTEIQKSQTLGHDGTEIGLPASFVHQLDVKTIPQIYMTGYSNISYSRDLNNHSRVDNFQVNASKEKGVHSIKFGFGWESDKTTGGGLFSADFYFDRGMTSGPIAATSSTTSGDAIASLLMGTSTSQSNVQKVALAATDRVSYSGYVQDTWRISKRLTLTPGLRYELQKPPTERYNRWSNFDYSVANPLGAQVGLPLKGGLVFLNSHNRYSWNPDYRDFAPRLGLSYKITEKLVARAGYGIFYPAVLGAGDMTGFSSTTPMLASQGGDGINPLNLLRNPYPNGLVPAAGSSLGLLTNLGLTVGSFTREHPNGYMQNYSLDLQYEISRHTVIEVGYAGNVGRKLSYGVTLNDNQLPAQLLSLGSQLDQKVTNPFYGYITSGSLSGPTIPYNLLLRPFPEFGNVNLSSASPGGSSNFNAMLIKVSKQFSNGLMLLSSYQWSKSIDNVAETEPGQTGTADVFRNYQNTAIERSISPNDIPHDFVTTLIYNLPFGKGRRFGGDLPKYVDFALGGWQVAGIVRFGTGFPVDMQAATSLNQYGFSGTQPPNISDGKAVKLSNPTPSQWFNTSVFSAPPPYTVGTAPRRINALREDGQHNADLAILKNFMFHERIRTQFRAEFFNLTNTPQFSWPNTTVGSTTFGQVTATTNVPPRNVQFGLKVDF
jgi:hypothetical protein